MKKHKYLCIFLICILLVAAIYISSDIYMRKTSEISFDSIRVLVNRDIDVLDEEQVHTLTVDFFGDGDNIAYDKPTYLGDDERLLLYLKDGSLAAVECEGDAFKLSVFSSDGELKSKIDLQTEPEQMLEYNGGIFLKMGADLYFWDYQSNYNLVRIDAENFTENSELFVRGNSYMYTGENCLYLYESISSSPKKIKTKSTCRGFLDDNTILLTKDLGRGSIAVYKYDIRKNLRYDFKFIYLPILAISTISPDGKYMMCLGSNELGPFYLYIYDTDTFARVQMDDFCVDTVKSIQWVE